MGTSIHVARDFSPYPAGRHLQDGPHSGEAFRENLLRPALKQGPVELVFDDVMGLPPSFLEEALGGLIRGGDFSLQDLERLLTIKAAVPRMQLHPDRAWSFIKRAAATSVLRPAAG